MVRVRGEFDVSACDDFRTRAVAALGSELVVVDLRGATFLDSHALGAMVELHTSAQVDGFKLAIVRPDGHADRIFSITGADGHLPLFDERVPILAQMNYG